MSRIHIQLPGRSLGTYRIPVRISDINYGNHLGNDAVVSILQEARMQFLAAHSFTELEAGGTSLIMADLAVQYKNEAFYGDILSVDIYCSDISRASFSIFYKLTCEREGKPLLIAIAKTGMVCFNYSRRKIDAMPPELRQILAPPQ